MDNPEFEKVLESITADINKTLKSNLGSYFKTIDNNNKVIDVLKSLLFSMPEYVKLKNDYEQLQDEYLTLKTAYDYHMSSNVKNIKMDISETFSTPCETTIIKNTETTQNEIIDPTTLSSNEEDDDEYEDEDETEVEAEQAKETEEEGVKAEEEEGEEEGEEESEDEEKEGEEEDEVEEECEEEGEDDEEEGEDEVEEEGVEEEGEEEEDEEEGEEEGEDGEEGVKAEEEESEDEEDEEESEEEDEVEIITIGSKKYYVNQETKDVYEFLKNEDIGDFIGKLENNKLVKKKL